MGVILTTYKLSGWSSSVFCCFTHFSCCCWRNAVMVGMFDVILIDYIDLLNIGCWWSWMLVVFLDVKCRPCRCCWILHGTTPPTKKTKRCHQYLKWLPLTKNLLNHFHQPLSLCFPKNTANDLQKHLRGKAEYFWSMFVGLLGCSCFPGCNRDHQDFFSCSGVLDL